MKPMKRPEPYPVGSIVELVRPNDWEGTFKDEWISQRFLILFNNINGDFTRFPRYNLQAYPSGQNTYYFYDHFEIRPARPGVLQVAGNLPNL